MSKKTALSIIIFIVLIAAAVVGYIMFSDRPDESVTPTRTNNGLPVVSNFFPESEDLNMGNGGGDDNNQNLNQSIPKLRQISENPVSGFIVFDTTSTSTIPSLTGGEGEVVEEELISETKTNYLFMNRSNGNIKQTDSKTLNVKRITNTTIPKVYESNFVDNENVVVRHLNEEGVIKSFFLKLLTRNENGATTTEILNDDFVDVEMVPLPNNVKNTLTSPEGLVFYTTETFGLLNGFVFDTRTPQTVSEILESNMTHLNFRWLNNTDILWGTKPSQNSNNLLFVHDAQSGLSNKLFETGPGLTFIPNKNSNFILYSVVSNNNLLSFVYDVDLDFSYNLNLNTIVGDKCAWSKTRGYVVYCAEPQQQLNSNYPITWYQGDVSLNDNLYEIDVLNKTKTKIEDINGEFDIINPQLSENDEYFVFINKKDLTLWSLNLNN